MSNMLRNSIAACAAILMLACAGCYHSPAQAQTQQGELLYPRAPTGIYIGGSYGIATYDTGVSDDEVVNLAGGSGYTLDEEDSAYSFFIGYAFDDALSLEFFYSDLGELSASGNLPFNSFAGRNFTCTDQTNCNLRIGFSSAGVAVKGSFRMAEDLSAFIKAGYHRYELSYRAIETSGTSFTRSVSDTSALVGFGFDYDISPYASMQFGYDAYLSDVRYLYLGMSFNLQPRF